MITKEIMEKKLSLKKGRKKNMFSSSSPGVKKNKVANYNRFFNNLVSKATQTYACANNARKSETASKKRKKNTQRQKNH